MSWTAACSPWVRVACCARVHVLCALCTAAAPAPYCVVTFFLLVDCLTNTFIAPSAPPLPPPRMHSDARCSAHRRGCCRGAAGPHALWRRRGPRRWHGVHRGGGGERIQNNDHHHDHDHHNDINHHDGAGDNGCRWHNSGRGDDLASGDSGGDDDNRRCRWSKHCTIDLIVSDEGCVVEKEGGGGGGVVVFVVVTNHSRLHFLLSGPAFHACA